jgi:hypothetical protein
MEQGRPILGTRPGKMPQAPSGAFRATNRRDWRPC